MKIVLDTNIIISALIRESLVRFLIINSPYKLFLPEFSFIEIKKHLPLIKKKSGLSEQEITIIMEILLRNIKIIPGETLIKYHKAAFKIMGKIDRDDVEFIAAALSVKDAIIWSDDAHFKRQNKIKVLNTKEILSLFVD
jgi:predicted nucleic acid-binding protein